MGEDMTGVYNMTKWKSSTLVEDRKAVYFLNGDRLKSVVQQSCSLYKSLNVNTEVQQAVAKAKDMLASIASGMENKHNDLLNLLRVLVQGHLETCIELLVSIHTCERGTVVMVE